MANNCYFTARPYSSFSRAEIDESFAREFMTIWGVGENKEQLQEIYVKNCTQNLSSDSNKKLASTGSDFRQASSEKISNSVDVVPLSTAVGKLLPKGMELYQIDIENNKKVCNCDGCLGYKENGWLHYLALSFYYKPNQGGKMKANVLKCIEVIDSCNKSWCAASRRTAVSAKGILSKIITKEYGYRSENGSNVRAFSLAIVRREIGRLLVINKVLEIPTKIVQQSTRQLFFDLAAEFRRRKAKWRPKPLEEYLNRTYETSFKDGRIDALTWEELHKSLFVNLRMGSLPHILSVRSLFEGRCEDNTEDCFCYLLEEAYPRLHH